MENDPQFEHALHKTLMHEGGYNNDLRDRGGETKYGISKRSYPDLDITNLTLAQAKEIYFRDFWNGPGIDKIKWFDLSAKVFDFGVTSGPKRAVRALQEALCLLGVAVNVDGILGPVTARAANSFRGQAALLAALKFLMAQHFVLCNEPHFLAGRLFRAMS